MVFHEEQHFSPALMASIIVSLTLVVAVLVGFFTPSGDWMIAMLVLAVPIALIVALFLWFKLVTDVSANQLHVGFPLGLSRTIPLSEIESAEAVRYRPLRDFGGWGFRIGRDGIMYNARGDQAVKLILKTGQTIFVGSARAEELARVLTAAQRGRVDAGPI